MPVVMGVHLMYSVPRIEGEVKGFVGVWARDVDRGTMS